MKNLFRIFPESKRHSLHGVRNLHSIVLKKREVHTQNGSTEKFNMSRVLLKEQKTDSDVKNYEPEEISSSTVTIDLSHVNKCISYKSMF